MSRKKTAKAGDFVQIPLEDGTYAYGKVLKGEVKFLNLRTATNEVLEGELREANAIFRVSVMEYALKPKSSWKVVGHENLSALDCMQHKYFIQDLINKEIRIYHESDEYPQGYKEWPATYEECVGLECAAVWDPEHVESRLLDHFEGRENKWVKSLALKPIGD